MQKDTIRLTTAQFAKLHEVNKRTLHYYDSIGLFTPYTKGENGYRYYDLSQSVDFEYIRMLKDLKMSIDEIEAYVKEPSPAMFLDMTDKKEQEIDMEIHKLQEIKETLRMKREQIHFCESLQDQEIRIEELAAEAISMIPYDFSDENLSKVTSSISDMWGMNQIRMGIGSYIAMEKVYDRNFADYDGIYTVSADASLPKVMKVKGSYLCGYQKGEWDDLPLLYEELLAYAEKNHLELEGYAYEIGLNEFVISDGRDYITKVMIKIKQEENDCL